MATTADGPYISCRQLLNDLESKADAVSSLVEQLKSRIGAFKTLVSSSVTATTAEYFAKPNSGSRCSLDKITSFTSHGQTFSIKPATSFQKELTIKSSDALGLEEGFTLCLVQEAGDDAEFRDIFLLYREERLALIRLFETIIRLSIDMEQDNNDSTSQPVCADIVRDVLKNDPKALENIVMKISLLMKYTPSQELQSDIVSDPYLEQQLTKYVLFEQQHLLQIAYLLKASEMLSVSVLSHLSILERAVNVEFGRKQNELYLQGNTEATISNIETLWIFLSLALFGVVQLSRPYTLPQVESPSYYMASPEHFLKLDDFFEKLGNSKAAGPLFLVWVCVLTRMRNAIERAQQVEDGGGVPDIWEQVASRLVLSVKNANQDPRTMFTSRALKCGILETFTTISRSSLFDDHIEPNAAAFQHHLRELLALFLTIVEPQYITNFDELIDCHVALYTNRPALSLLFWSDVAEHPERGAIFEVAAARFPASLSPLLKLSTALSSVEESSFATYDSSSAKQVLKLLSHLTSYTAIMDNVTTRSAFDIFEDDTSIVRATEDIVFPNGPHRATVIEEGTIGRIVSMGTPYVIRWTTQFSAVQYCAGILEDIGWQTKFDETDYDEAIQSATLIFDLFATAVKHDKQLASGLVQHAIDVDSRSVQRRHIPQLVDAVFRTIQRLFTFEPTPLHAIAKGLECLASLLPGAGDIFWHTFKRSSLISEGSALRFTPRGSRKSLASGPGGQLLQLLHNVECGKGHFPVTLAFIKLVHRILEQALAISWRRQAVSADLVEIVNDVSFRCVKYLQNEVFASHLTWKYAKTAERTDLQDGMFKLFGFIMQTAPQSAFHDPLGNVGAFVANSFIGEAATLQQVAPLTHILATSHALEAGLRSKGEGHLADKSQSTLLSALIFTRRLLRQRVMVLGTRPCLLEQHFFDRVKGTELVVTLSKYFSDRNPVIAAEAAQVLSLLAVSSSRWKQKPSWLGYLHGKELLESIKAGTQSQHAARAIASWNWLSIVAEQQSGFAASLLSGKESSLEVDTGANVEMTSSSPLKIAIDMVSSDRIKGMWDNSPRTAVAVLRFLDVIWHRLAEYRSVVEGFRRDQSQMLSLWQGLIVLLSMDEAEREDAIDSDTCYHYVARSHAASILASEMIYSDEHKGNQTCREEVFKILQNAHHMTLFEKWIMQTSLDLDARDDLQEIVQERGITLDLIKNSAWSDEYDMDREYGSDYMWNLDIAKIRLDFSSEADWADPFTDRLFAVNLSLSLVDAEVSLLRGLNTMIGTAALGLSTKSPTPVFEQYVDLLTTISAALGSNDNANAVAVNVPALMTIYAERISLLLAALQPWHRLQQGGQPEHFITILKNLLKLATSQEYPVEDSLKGVTAVAYHRDLFQMIYLVLRRLRSATLKEDQVIRMRAVSEHLYGVSARFVPVICSQAIQKGPDALLSADMETICSVVAENIQLKDSALPSVWLPLFLGKGVTNSLLNVFRHAADFYESSLLPARPCYVESVLSLLLLMSKLPLVAQSLATEGLVAAFLDNSLSEQLQQGRLSAAELAGNSDNAPAIRSPFHATWLSMISLVTSVLIHLGDNSQFVRVDVMAFVQLYAAQLHRSLSWQVMDESTFMTTALLDEMRAVTVLYTNITTRMVSLHGNEYRSRDRFLLQENQIIRAYVDRLVSTVQQLTWLLVHPTQLATIIEPLDNERRLGSEKWNQFATERITVVMGALLQSMMLISDAEHVLTHESLTWPSDRAITWPHLSVSIENGASIGTLFDLATWAIDSYKDKPSVILVTILEYSLTLIGTQMALHLFGDDGGVLEPRQRRDITGEMASDLGSLCDKVEMVMSKSTGAKLHPSFLPYVQRFVNKWVV